MGVILLITLFISWIFFPHVPQPDDIVDCYSPGGEEWYTPYVSRAVCEKVAADYNLEQELKQKTFPCGGSVYISSAVVGSGDFGFKGNYPLPARKV